MLRTLQSCLFAFFIFAASAAQGQSYRFLHETLPCLNKKFTVVAHIFQDSLGGYGVTEDDINNAFAESNPFFEPIGVSFEACEFRYHDNWSHDFIDSIQEADEVTLKYHANNRINFYFVTEPNDANSPCGFATLNGIQQPVSGRVFIKKEDCVNVGTFAHELGHFFGLLHTFEGNGTELVDGSNCATEGDMICDTPADPYTPPNDVSQYVDDDCVFISNLTDANGDYYNPDIGNIMSYYECDKCGFTWEQLKLMADNYLNAVVKFW